MRLCGHAFRRLGTLIAIVALCGLAGPAHAAPQFFTFEGPITFSETCVSGAFIFQCDPIPIGNVSYTFLVDFSRPGEEITRDASGETVTTVPGTFLALFGADEPRFGPFGPVSSRHVGMGLTLLDVESSNGLHGLCPVCESASSLEITGLPLSAFSIGAHFAGHEFHLLHQPGVISSFTSRIDSSLTLTEIHGVSEPGIFPILGAGVLTVAGIAWWSERKRQRMEEVR